MGDILRLLAEFHHSRAARIRVAGGGAGGDAPDAHGPGASLRSAPATQASFPIMGYNESRWSSARSLDLLMVEVLFPPVTRRARNKNKSEMNRCLPIWLSRPTSYQPRFTLMFAFPSGRLVFRGCRRCCSTSRIHNPRRCESMMNHNDCMLLAITMAAKCKPANSKETPRVGAVIVLNGAIIAMASRGVNDHAEKIAIDEARERGADLTQATVYTTLEPCVAGVRRRTLDSSPTGWWPQGSRKSSLAFMTRIRKLPAKASCGYRRDASRRSFSPELAQRIKDINEEFIRAQQSLEIRITYPKNGDSLPTEPGKIVTLKGTWINRPDPLDSVYAISQCRNFWWPQRPLEPVTRTKEEWETVINIGATGSHKVLVGKVNHLGKTLIKYYRRVIDENMERYDMLRRDRPDFVIPWDPWIGIEVEGGEPPKGIDREDEVEFTIADLVDKKS